MRGESDQGPTVVVSVAVLLAPFESGVEAETAAVFESMMAGDAITVTVIVTVAFPDAASAPMFAVTRPVVPTFGKLQVPWLATQLRLVVPAGRGSFITTSLAAPGPLFVTVMV